MPPKRERVTKLLADLDGVLQETVLNEDLQGVLDTIAARLNEYDAAVDRKTEELRGETSTALERQVSALQNALSAVREELRGEVGAVDTRSTQSLSAAVTALQGALEEVRGEITPPFDPAYLEEALEDMREQLPESFDPSDLTESIEELAEQIEELRQAIEDMKKVTTPRRVGGIFGGRVTHVPMTDAFSGDGATKTFYLTKSPRDLATVTAFCTDFPSVMVNTRGFTISGKAVTLEASVDAPSLNARLIINYYV